MQQTLQRTEHANQKEAVALETRLESVRAEYDRRVQDLKEGKELLQEQVRRCNMACKEQLVKHEHEVFSCRCLCFFRSCVGGCGCVEKGRVC